LNRTILKNKTFRYNFAENLSYPALLISISQKQFSPKFVSIQVSHKSVIQK